MTLDAADVESEVQSVEQAVEQVGPAAETAGTQASRGFEHIGDAAQHAKEGAAGAWNELEKLGEQGKSAASALERLEAAGDSPRALIKNAAAAEIEVNQLRDALDKAAASGVKFGPEVGAALERAESKIGAAAKRSRELADAAGDLKTRGDQAAKGLESVAGSAGSVEGLLGRLKDTSGATGLSLSDISIKGKTAGETFANLGFGVMAAAGAFTMGYEAGQRINAFLESHGNYLAKAVDWTVRFVSGVQSEKEMLAALDGPVNKSLRSHQELAKSASEAAVAAKAIGVAFSTEGEAISGWTNKVAALSFAMVTAKNAGQSWDSLVQANAVTIKALVEEGRKLGLTFEELPPALRLAAEGLTAFHDAQEKTRAGFEDTARAAKQLGSEAGAAFMAGNVREWATANAAAVVSTVKSWQEEGTALAKMTAVQQAAFKVAKEAVGAQKLAVEEYARSAIQKYADIEAAQRRSVDAARASAQTAEATFNAEMRALNAMSVTEEEYSTRKKAIYNEMMEAVSSAYAKETEATKESKNAQAALMDSLSLSPEKFKEVGAAASVYADAIKNGATPTDAVAKAAEALGKGLAAMQKSVEIVTIAPLTEKMGALGEASSAAITNVNGIVQAIGQIPGSTQGALASLRALEQGFRNVAAAAAAAAGAGGGEPAPASLGG